MILSFAIRQRAHAAGLEPWVERLAAGSRALEDLLLVATAPLPLVAALVARVSPSEAAVLGTLPVRLLADVGETCQTALAHRAAAEAECLELQVDTPCAVGALDHACEVVRRLRRELPGAGARIDAASLEALAAGAGLPVEGAASRLAAAGVDEVLGSADGPLAFGPLPALQRWQVPEAIDEAFVQRLLDGPRRPLLWEEARQATGIVLLRAVALARLLGHGPIAVRCRDELKGPDACLSFGAERLEAALDPAGSMGSRTRAYGQAAVRGAQLQLRPARRAAAAKKTAHILDEQVDPSLLPGGDAHRLEVLP